MIDSNRTSSSNVIGGLLIVGLLLTATGCQQFGGRLPLPGTAHDPNHAVPSDQAFQPPSAADVAAPATAEVQIAPTYAGAEQGGIQQASHNERHTARQFPNSPTSYGQQPVAQAIPGQAIPGQAIPGQAIPGQAIPGQANAGWVGNQPNQSVVPVQYGQTRVTPGLPGSLYPPIGTDPIYTPTTREADLIINGYPGRTGRLTFGAAVNSDAGVTGQITIDERNFDICRFPRSFQDLFSGNAFRGKGQTLRIEAVPGSDFDRYIINFANPNLFTYLPISMSLGGFLYDRRFTDWDEERLGARMSLGYRVTPDLSVSVGISGQNVNISNPRSNLSPALNRTIGDNELYSGSVSIKHDTRNSPIQASDGHYFEFSFEEAFGKFDYARFELEYRTYWLLAQRADFSGKQTLSYSTKLGFSGNDTPVFENFFAGGYATLRGFDFRGASPVQNGIEVGGQFQWLNTVEYMFPITADDAFRGVAFVDFGTVEQSARLDADSYRVAPGLGLRVAIPMLGPAPLAFDFAYPVAKAETDQKRIFSFYMSLIR